MGSNFRFVIFAKSQYGQDNIFFEKIRFKDQIWFFYQLSQIIFKFVSIRQYPSSFIFRTLKSKTTCKEENPECVLPEKPSKLVNPIVACTSACDDKQNCSMFNVTAKGFFSSYTQKIEQEVLDGAKALINEVELFLLNSNYCIINLVQHVINHF